MIEKDAQATLIESHEGGDNQVNTALELRSATAPRSITSRPRRRTGCHVVSLLASIGAKASFNSFAFNAGAGVVRNQMFVRFDGEGTHAALRGATLAKGKDHVDTTW